MDKMCSLAGDSSMSPVQEVYDSYPSIKKLQAGELFGGKISSASAGILIEEVRMSYAARSKQLPRAQGATRGNPISRFNENKEVLVS